MIVDPSAKRIEIDLQDRVFVSAIAEGRWRIIRSAFPTLDFAITATEPDGARSEYGFQAELSNYPTQAPMVRIWDHGAKAPLQKDKRPKGGPRILVTFQVWGSDTVYRPWDRLTGLHNNNAGRFPHLAWRPDRQLLFIFEDLHGILNSNARALAVRASA